MEATEWYHGRCVDVSCGHVWLQPENSFWLLTATDGYCKLRAMEPDWRKCEAVAAWMANSIQHHAATPTLIQPYPPAANATQDHPTTDPPPLPYYHTKFVPTSTSHPSQFPQQLPRSQLFFISFGPPWALDILWAKWSWATSPCWEDVALPAAVSGRRCRGRQPWWLRADMAEPGRARGDLGQADAGVVAWMIPLSRGV